MNDSIKLTTKDAQELITMLKKKVSSSRIIFPSKSNKLELDVIAYKDQTKFVINIIRSGKNIEKCSYHGRTSFNCFSLLRLDICATAVHYNSDGSKIIGNHLHIYNEETEMRDAISFNIDNSDLYANCLEFFSRFNLMLDKSDITFQEEISFGG